MTEYADTINERLMLDRIAELRAKVSDADKVISGLAQALTAGQVQYAELEAQLDEAKKAATWVPITAQSLPVEKEEVLLIFSSGSIEVNEVDTAWSDCRGFVLSTRGYHRPINAPQEPA